MLRNANMPQINIIAGQTVEAIRYATASSGFVGSSYMQNSTNVTMIPKI
jgi:hypothetical protein